MRAESDRPERADREDLQRDGTREHHRSWRPTESRRPGRSALRVPNAADRLEVARSQPVVVRHDDPAVLGHDRDPLPVCGPTRQQLRDGCCTDVGGIAPKVRHHLADGQGVLVDDEPNPRQLDHVSCGQVVHDSEVDCLLYLVLGQLVPLGDLRDGVAAEYHAREGDYRDVVTRDGGSATATFGI